MTEYDSLTTLHLREQMRTRPGMWIGNVLSSEYDSAKNHVVKEVVGNSMDEFMAGHGKEIIVTLINGRTVIVQDFGRGIPHGVNPKTGNSFVEDAASQGSTGGKYAKGAEGSPYKVSLGLHGYGLKCANFTASHMTVDSVRDGKEVIVNFAKGEKTGLHQGTSNKPTGTTITFSPDPEVFPNPEINPDHIRQYLTGLAYINPGLKLTFIVITNGDKQVEDLSQPRGLYAKLDTMASRDLWLSKEPIRIFAKDEATENSIEALLVFTKNDGESHIAYVNSGAIGLTSAPVATARAAMGRGINDALTSTFGKLPEGTKPDDLRAGVISVIKIMHTDPMFDGQVKDKLINTDMNALISGEFTNKARSALLEDEATLKVIFDHTSRIVKAREAAKAARDKIMNEEGGAATTKTDAASLRAIPLKVFNPPLKNDPGRNQIFMLEGEGAAGTLVTAVKATDPVTKALYKNHIGILTLRGVTLNTLEHSLGRILNGDNKGKGGSAEYSTLVAVSGLNPKNPNDLSKVKFRDFIIATDEDAGGAFIANQLMTFFIVHFPAVVRAGRLFRIRTPLFEVTVKKQPKQYVYAWEDLNAKLLEFGLDPARSGKDFFLKRNKGLGELSDGSAVDVMCRNQKLQQIKSDNPEELLPLLDFISGGNFSDHRKDILTKVALPEVED